jgi:hypothetical protein
MGRLRSALIVLAGLAWLSASVPALAQAPKPERPVYALGERWILQDGAYDLVRIQGEVYVFAAAPGREIHLTSRLLVARVVRDRVVEWDLSPPPVLRWPLEVGKWGIANSVLRTRDHPSGVSVRATWEIKAYEDVEVRAGTFKAFRIVQSAEIEDSRRLGRDPGLPGRQQWTFVTWYAPEARMIVKVEAPEVRGLGFQVVAIDRPAGTPIDLTLRAPGDGARVTTERVAVEGKVRAGEGIARITITLNGAEVLKQDERPGGRKEADLSLPIQLREGKNVLLVTAMDQTGKSRQEARVVFYDRPPPVAPAPGMPGPAPPVPAGPPLQVLISSPADQSRVAQESIALAALASGARGVSRVIVTLNGVEVARLEERAPRRAVPVNLPLKLRDGQNILVVTAADADGVTQQEVRTVHLETVAPLSVEVRHPDDRTRVTEAVSLVAAVITSSRGVTRVSVTLNGAQVHQQVERAPQKSVVVTVPVTLREGANAIVVSATEPDGTVRQEVRTVVYERAPAARAEPRRPVERDRWAVVIGIGRYEKPQIPALRYTVSDAEVFHRVLVEQAGFKRENVLLLTDHTERKPTLRTIKWALGTFLARSAKKEDLVIIYFAGHGAPEVDPRGIESDGLAKYLVSVDADPNDLYSTALPMDEFQTIFGRIEAERVVVFLDACYSGAAGGRTFASQRTRAAAVDDVFLERLTRSKGRAIITASRAAEVSLELPELGHGIFTHYLIQGFRGTADLDRDGIVSLQELYEYLEQQVSRKSRAAGGNQHPVMKGELEGVLPLVKVGGR